MLVNVVVADSLIWSVSVLAGEYIALCWCCRVGVLVCASVCRPSLIACLAVDDLMCWYVSVLLIQYVGLCR